jgi:hypothetical protein
MKLLQRRWARELVTDPFYNPNFVPNRDDWAIKFG